MSPAAKASIAKISIPRLFGVVERGRLFAKLEENRGRPLLWISGPPGAGKTTLAASYVESGRMPAVWYQVDAGDADSANLFHYLALAVGGFAAGQDPQLPRFLSEHVGDVAEYSRLFFRGLFAQLPAGTVVVFDNYQDAPAEAQLHEIVRNAVQEVPPGCSILCLSRERAPPGFAPLLAQGAMLSLHWDMLRLTVEETRQICAARGIGDQWLVQALHQQSEGWAAGITLMLERLGHDTLGDRELPTDTHESVFNYFAALLFDQSDDRTRRILLSLAWLPYFTEAMVDAVSGEENAGALIDGLYRRHLFTDRRPAVRPVYQFHALFRAFLQARASEQQDVALIDRHRIRCAGLLEAENDIEAAMDLRLDASDWEGAGTLALQQASTMLTSGRGKTLERWILLLPDGIFAERPYLGYWLAMAQVRSGSGNGPPGLQSALERFRNRGDAQGEILCLVALLNTAFVAFSKLDAMHEWLEALLDRVERLDVTLAADLELKVWGVLCSALFWIQPWHPWTGQAAERVGRLVAEMDAEPDVLLAAAAGALATTSMNGNFECGDRIVQATLQLAADPRANPPDATWWFVHAGFLRFFEARYEESLAFLQRAGEIADRHGMRKTFVMVDLHRCAVECRVFGWRVAGATLTECESKSEIRYPMAQAMAILLHARWQQSLGKVREAADLAMAADVATSSTGSRYQEVLLGLIEAEFVADAGRATEAAALIDRSRTLIDRSPAFDCWRASLEFVQAWLAHTQGNVAVCAERLALALSLAKHGSRRFYLRHFEKAMSILFAQALEQGIEPDLVKQVIRMFRLKPAAGAPDAWPWRIRVRSLGRFDVVVDDKPLEFSRKVPRKTLALLKVLIALGGQEVSERAVCDALWSDEEADAAGEALAITILRLRKLLGLPEAILHRGGKVALDRSLCWVDAWRLEQLASSETGDAVLEALDLYGGSFLPEDEGEPWSVASRERLRGRFIHLLATHGSALEGEGSLDAAIRFYLRGLEADPIVEAFHQGLMRCYQQLDRSTEAIGVYRRMRQVLSVVLGVSPSQESQVLYQSILQTCPAAVRDAPDASVVPLRAPGSGEKQGGRSARKRN